MVNDTIRQPDQSFGRDSLLTRAARWSAPIVALAAVLATPASVHGQTTGGMSSMGNGLSVKADWWNVGASAGGYCPVRIEVTNNTNAPRRLRFSIDATYPRDMDITQTIEVDAKNKAAFTMSVPIVNYNMYGRLRVYERGRELDKLSMFGIAGTVAWSPHAVPSVLIVTSSSPDLRNFNESVVRIATGSTGNQSGYSPLVLPVDKVPTKWIDFSLLDVVMLSTQQLDLLTADSREAIIEWTMTGGNLFVYGAKDGEKSPEFIRLLDLENRAPRGAEWRSPRPEDHNNEMIASGQGATIWTGRGPRRLARPVPNLGQTATTTPTTADTAKEKANFSIRPFGLGQLIVSSDANPFAGATEDWAWVFKTFGQSRLYWAERHGVSARSENDDFWLFLIPGVGRAPVMGFQVLITLFAVMIGPVNYFVLRRKRRLYFLILTVPSVALVTTLMLLGYAVASDGFTLRTRVRSLTMLDQRRSEAVSWSRISYYAGLAPSGGLRFSRDTAVYPIQPTGGANMSKSTDWTEDQHLTSGWLRSRTPTQLLTVSYRQAEEQLAVVTDPSGKMRVTNNLGANILGLFVVGEDGFLYSAEGIAPGASVRLEPQVLDDAIKPVRKLVTDQKLELPEEMQAANTGGLFGPRRGPAAWRWNQFTPTTSAGSVIESVIRTFGGDPKELQSFVPPRSYIAVVEKPPIVDLGVQKTEDHGSLYVIWGLY